MLIPNADILGLQTAKAARFSHHGLALVLRGHEELFLEFSSTEQRDACRRLIDRQLNASSAQARQKAQAASKRDENGKNEEDDDDDGVRDISRAKTAAEREAIILERLDAAKINQPGQRPTPPAKVDPNAPNLGELPPVMFTSGEASLLDFKPKKRLHITCLTIGSRGDVQPCTFMLQNFKGRCVLASR